MMTCLLLVSTVGATPPALPDARVLRPVGSSPAPVQHRSHRHDLGLATSFTNDGHVWHSLQPWYRHFGQGFEVFAEGQFASGAQPVVGVGARAYVVDGHRGRAGLGVRAGYTYAQVELPLAALLAGPVWIYTSPSVGSSEWPVIVPVGLVVAGGGLLVSAEGGMMYSTTEGMLLGVGAVAAGLSF